MFKRRTQNCVMMVAKMNRGLSFSGANYHRYISMWCSLYPKVVVLLLDAEIFIFITLLFCFSCGYRTQTQHTNV